MCARLPAARPTVVAQLGAAATVARGNPKGNAEMGPRKPGTPDGAVPTIFARPDTEHIHSQLAVIAGMLPAGAGDHRKGVPVVEPMRWDDADDAIAFTSVPVGHWKEVQRGRRRRESASFQPRALLRLAGAVLG